MTVSIEVFYSFQSPYSYLALDSIYEMEKKYDVELLWQPYSAKASGHTLPPSTVNPDKLSYLFEDAKRHAADLNVPLEFPENWPQEEFDPSRVIRGAIVANDLGFLMEYNVKVFHRWWGLGGDPNDDEFLSELCEELDIDLGEFLSKISNSDTRERVKGIYKRGRNLGIFDTPTLVIDKERFAGFDKVQYLCSRLEKQGSKK